MARKTTQTGTDPVVTTPATRRRTPRLHVAAPTDGSVVEAKPARKEPAKKSAPTTKATTPKTNKAVKVTKSSRVYAEFEKGASLTEAAKTTRVEPAYVWDLAAAWEKRTGKRVPRNGRLPKAAPEAVEATK